VSYINASNGLGEPVQAILVADRGIGDMELNVDSVLNWSHDFIATVGTIDVSTGTFDPSSVSVFYGYLSGSFIEIDHFAPGYTDKGNFKDQIVVIKPATAWADEVDQAIDDTQTSIPTEVSQLANDSGYINNIAPIQVSADHTKVGIGKAPTNGALDVAGDIYSNGEQVFSQQLIEAFLRTDVPDTAFTMNTTNLSALTIDGAYILGNKWLWVNFTATTKITFDDTQLVLFTMDRTVTGTPMSAVNFVGWADGAGNGFMLSTNGSGNLYFNDTINSVAVAAGAVIQGGFFVPVDF